MAVPHSRRVVTDERGAAPLVAAVALGLVTLVLALFMATVLLASTMTSQASGCGPGSPVPASADLDPAILAAINALKPNYEQVAAEKNLSWALLAAIDYREDGNDPNQSALSGEPIGATNPDSGAVTTSKLDSIVQAADHMKEMAASVYGVTLTAASGGDDVKNAFVAYNRGYSYKQDGAAADTSPYVMNQYDEAHHNMVFPNIAGETLAGRTDTRPGAFTVFTRLGGSSTSACGGLSGNKIVAIAQQQLNLAEIPKGCNCGPEIQKFLGSSGGEEWCADFVSWVYNAAGVPFTGGADGGWRLPGVSGIHQWFADHGVWHDRGSADVPQPGDVVDFGGGGHTGIVEKVDGTTLDTIEGNTSDQVARRSYSDYASSGDIAGWGRQTLASSAPTPAALGPDRPALVAA